MKKHTLILITLMLLGGMTLSAGGAREEYPEDFTLRVSALNGPTGIGMIHLIDEKPDLGDGIAVDYSIAMAPKALMGDLAKKTLDIAVLPANMPALLHAKAPGYKVAAVSGMGTLYIVSYDKSITSLEDLKGKTLFNGAKGATPDFLTRYLLDNAGIDSENDLYMDFSYGLADLAKAVIGGLAETAVLPEPFITMITSKSEAEIVLDLQELWMEQRSSADSYPMSVLVVRDEILENYPGLVDRFLSLYEDSINRVIAEPLMAAELVPANGFTMSADITGKAIPRLNLKYADGEDAKALLDDYYNILFQMDPKTVGGAVPGDELYYIER